MFTKEDLNEVREIIRSNKVAAPAKAGAIAPIDVKVAPINTGLGPEKTSFFQALAIPTKITRGTIEILVRKKAVCHSGRVGRYLQNRIMISVWEIITIFDNTVTIHAIKTMAAVSILGYILYKNKLNNCMNLSRLGSGGSG